METACVDGALVPLADAVIPVGDDGLLRGDGVFEVLRLYDGVPFARKRHLERMGRSAQRLRLTLDIGEVDRDIDRLLAAEDARDGLLRVVATHGGRRILLIEPLPALPATITLGYVTFAPTRVLDGVKSLSYAANMLAKRLARERGFDDALLLSPHGRVLELPTASIFWITGGRVHTPPLSEHILDSITRRIVIEVADAQEATTTPADLQAAEEVFAASSVYEVTAVSRIEERDLPASRPVTERTARDVRARIGAELAGD